VRLQFFKQYGAWTANSLRDRAGNLSRASREFSGREQGFLRRQQEGPRAIMTEVEKKEGTV
jgi:hypothetical protein